jgi:hypothetical protein
MGLNTFSFTATFKRCLQLPAFAFLPSKHPAGLEMRVKFVNLVPRTESYRRQATRTENDAGLNLFPGTDSYGSNGHVKLVADVVELMGLLLLLHGFEGS